MAKYVGEVGDLLIRLLKSKGATEDETVGILLMLREPKEQWKLVKWMASNRTASPQEIFQKALDMANRES